MASKERKFKYWHIITAVNKFYKERNPEIIQGGLITHYPIWNGPVRFTDITHPEFGDYWAYSILYIGKLPSDLTGDSLIREIDKLVWKFEDEPLPSKQ